MNDNTLVLEALDALDPHDLAGYGDWLKVAQGLHHEGYGYEVFGDWLTSHGMRFDEHLTRQKWRSFGSYPGTPVTGGTIVQMARDAGWRPARRPWDAPDGDEAMEWDAPIICDPSWLEPAELPERPWDPVSEAVRYLESVFDAEDVVGYVTTSFKGDDGRWKPSGKGAYDRTAGKLVEDLRRTRSIEDALGTADPEAGAWIRFNPLTGAGVRNADVAEFRHALVESDELDQERQLALIRELQLPCSAIVDSGGKSMHAIVRVDAADYAEYRRRVDYLYRVCERNGMKVDTQNKNPSRLSRFPGFERAGRRQRMVEGRCGAASWAEWVDFIEATEDDLPEFENLGGIWDDMPELAPELIHGILRRGHKMLVAAGSKTGKTFAMMELSAAIAEGLPWLGFRCERGRVLYINLELDRASCLRRFRDVYAALGVDPAHVGDIDVWNLRGKSMPMDRLVPSLVRRALKTRPAAIILDPVYKVNMGDENSAEQVARFCNQLDMVAEQVGASIVYVHHHSKGQQGQKASIDRASGSGVFARDADAQVDMVVLPLDDDARKVVEDDKVGRAAAAWMDAHVPGWEDAVDADAALAGGDLLVSECRRMLDASHHPTDEMLAAVHAARAAVPGIRGLRVEFTLREFATPAPVDVWFDEPLHRRDELGILGDIELDPEARRRKEETPTEMWHREAVTATGMAIAGLLAEGLEPTKEAVAARIGIVRAWSRAGGRSTLKPMPAKPENLDRWVKADWYPFAFERRTGEDGGSLPALLHDTREPSKIREYAPWTGEAGEG